MLIDRAANKLSLREAAGRKRSLEAFSKNSIDFSSNDYLGLARSPQLFQAVLLELDTAKEQHGLAPFGATGSRLVSGHNLYVEAVEEEIARFHGFDSCLIFGSGYLANTGLLGAVAGQGDRVICDVEVHASMLEGARNATEHIFHFRHNDLEHLEKRLKKSYAGNTYVCIESLYSMSGTTAPLIELIALCEQYGAMLIVDEAHAIGVLGVKGEGLAAAAGLQKRVLAVTLGFGKAVGAYGGAVLSGKILREYLINFSKSFIYSTALPLSCFAAIRCGYQLLPRMNFQRLQLRKLALKFSAGSPTPIQPIYTQSAWQAKHIAQALNNEGIAVKAILSPTVPKNKECLRVSLHAYNSEEEIGRLIQWMQENTNTKI